MQSTNETDPTYWSDLFHSSRSLQAEQCLIVG